MRQTINLHASGADGLAVPPDVAAQRNREMQAMQQMAAIRNNMAMEIFMRQMGKNLPQNDDAISRTAKSAIAAAENFLTNMSAWDKDRANEASVLEV